MFAQAMSSTKLTRRKQHEQALTNVADHLQMQGDQADTCLRVRLGVGRCELRREEIG